VTRSMRSPPTLRARSAIIEKEAITFNFWAGAWAEAESEEITIDTAELEDARWFTRDEVAAALAGSPAATFQPPPKAAIARTLLERWLAA